MDLKLFYERWNENFCREKAERMKWQRMAEMFHSKVLQNNPSIPFAKDRSKNAH